MKTLHTDEYPKFIFEIEKLLKSFYNIEISKDLAIQRAKDFKDDVDFIYLSSLFSAFAFCLQKCARLECSYNIVDYKNCSFKIENKIFTSAKDFYKSLDK